MEAYFPLRLNHKGDTRNRIHFTKNVGRWTKKEIPKPRKEERPPPPPWPVRMVRFVQRDKENFWPTPIFAFVLVVALGFLALAMFRYGAFLLVETLIFVIGLYCIFSVFGFPYPFEWGEEGWFNFLNKPLFYDDMGEYEVHFLSDPDAKMSIVVSRNTGNFMYACVGISIFALIWVLFAVEKISLAGALLGTTAYFLAMVTFTCYLLRYNFSFKDDFGEPVNLDEIDF